MICHGLWINHKENHVYMSFPAQYIRMDVPTFAVTPNTYRWYVLLDNIEYDD